MPHLRQLNALFQNKIHELPYLGSSYRVFKNEDITQALSLIFLGSSSLPENNPKLKKTKTKQNTRKKTKEKKYRVKKHKRGHLKLALRSNISKIFVGLCQSCRPCLAAETVIRDIPLFVKRFLTETSPSMAGRDKNATFCAIRLK